MTSTRTKRQKLHFERSCKCKNHEVIVAKYIEDPYRVYTVGSKDYSRKSYNYLVSKGFLTNRCKYVCNNRLKYAAIIFLRKMEKKFLLMVMKVLMIIQKIYQQN